MGTVAEGCSAYGVTSVNSLRVGGQSQIGVSIAGLAAPTPRVSVGTFAVAAVTAAATKSTTTAATITGLATTDIVSVAPTSSGLSNGLALNAYVTAANTLTLNFSNASTAAAVQAAGTYRYVAVRANG